MQPMLVIAGMSCDHKMVAIMEDIFAKVEKVDGDIRKHKKKQKNPHTWKDSAPNTVYLD